MNDNSHIQPPPLRSWLSKRNNLPVFLFFVIKAIPMVFSGMSIYLGYKLFVLGVTDQASIVVHATEVSGQLLNAAPGLFFAVGGFVCLIFSIVKGAKLDFDNEHGDFHSQPR